MTELRDTAIKMFIMKSVERIERMKHICLFLTLSLAVSVALNLAFALHYIEENEGCKRAENRQENMHRERYDLKSTVSSWKVICPMKNQK